MVSQLVVSDDLHHIMRFPQMLQVQWRLHHDEILERHFSDEIEYSHFMVKKELFTVLGRTHMTDEWVDESASDQY